MVKLIVAGELVPPALVAVTVTEKEPVAVGVPEITPPVIVKPVGNVPLAKA